MRLSKFTMFDTLVMKCMMAMGVEMLVTRRYFLDFLVIAPPRHRLVMAHHGRQTNVASRNNVDETERRLIAVGDGDNNQ